MQGGILQEKRDSDGWNALILLRICTEFVPVTPFNEGMHASATKSSIYQNKLPDWIKVLSVVCFL